MIGWKGDRFVLFLPQAKKHLPVPATQAVAQAKHRVLRRELEIIWKALAHPLVQCIRSDALISPVMRDSLDTIRVKRQLLFGGVLW